MEPGSFWTALVWAVVPALLLLAAIWWADRYEKEPLRLVGLALVFGAVLAPLAAYVVEDALDLRSSLAGGNVVPRLDLGLGTPLVEEAARGLAVLAVLLLVRFELDDALDGIVYGGVVGVGFGAAANFVSIWSTPSLGEATTPSLYASMVTGLNHVFYGAVIGLAIALARRARVPVLLAAGVAGTAAAFGLHALHDYLPWWAASPTSSPDSGFWSRLVTQAPNYLGLVALAVIALWTLGRQKVIVGRYLRDETEAGVVTPADFANVTNSFRRSYTLWTSFLAHGERVWRLRRRLYAQEVELAFRKFHREEERVRSQSRLFLPEDEYRDRIRETRRLLYEVDPTAEREGTAGAPKPPSNALIAGLGGLAAFAALVAAGILLWVLALRPSEEPASPARAAPAAAAPVAHLAAVRAVRAAAGFGVAVYRGRCRSAFAGGPAGPWRVPRATTQAFVCLSWFGAKAGDTVSIEFVDAGTNQAVLKSVRASLPAPQGAGLVKVLRGPFPKLTMEMRLTYNGSLVDCRTACRVVFG